MLNREIHGDKTQVFGLSCLLRTFFILTSLVISSTAVVAQSSTVIEPCPAQTPAATGSASVPAKVDVKVSETVIDSAISDDPAVREMLAPYREKVAALSVVIGKLESDLKRESIGAGPLGNFVTDAMLREAIQKSGKNVVLALSNAGGLRKAEIAAGQLHVSDIFELLPFENALLVVDLSGAQILKILQTGVRDPRAGTRIQYRWNAQNRTEVISVKLVDKEKPIMQQQPCGQKTAIFQVGKSGIYVGRVDFTLSDGKVVKTEGQLIDLREV